MQNALAIRSYGGAHRSIGEPPPLLDGAGNPIKSAFFPVLLPEDEADGQRPQLLDLVVGPVGEIIFKLGLHLGRCDLLIHYKFQQVLRNIKVLFDSRWHNYLLVGKTHETDELQHEFALYECRPASNKCQ